MEKARACLEEIRVEFDSSTLKSVELLERVTDLFFLTLDEHTQEDRDVFGIVMERMAYELDEHCRARFSERISKADRAPSKLLRRLGSDEIYIARPVLQLSEALREGDLVSLCKDVSQDHLRSITFRHALTSPVTDLLISRGDDHVRLSVTRNSSAVFSPESLAILELAAKEDPMLREALKARERRANPIRHLRKLTDAAFWQHVAESLLMTDEESDVEPQEPAKDLKEDEAEVSETEESSAPEPEAEFEEIPRNSPIEKALVTAARNGSVPETIYGLKTITKLEEQLVEHCLFQAHIPALLVLCKAHGLALTTFTTLLQLRASETKEEPRDMPGLIRRYEGMTPDTAQRIIKFSEKRKALDESIDEAG